MDRTAARPKALRRTPTRWATPRPETFRGASRGTDHPAIGSRLRDHRGTVRAIANRSPERHGPDRRAIESPSQDPHAMGHPATGNLSQGRRGTDQHAMEAVCGTTTGGPRDRKPSGAWAGPPRDRKPFAGPPRDGPARDRKPFAGPPREGPPRDRKPFGGPPRDGPPRDRKPFAGPPRDGPPRDRKPFGGPPRDGPPGGSGRKGPPRPYRPAGGPPRDRRRRG